MSTINPLDNPKTFTKYDSADIAFGVERLSQQLKAAFEGVETVNVPKAYKAVDHVLIIGMGGSSLGGHVLQTGLSDRLKASIDLMRGYSLPKWVNSKTLVILSSFSGNTEEVLYAAKQAKARGAKVMVIASGGKLASLAKRQKYPAYIFKPGDLAKEPRLGIGFSVAGMLGLLESVGLVKISKKEKLALVSAMIEVVDSCALDVSEKENPAKQVAQALKGRPMFIVGAEHLTGVAHVLVNQINETAKQFAQLHELPELNHHLMEGLAFPKGMFSKFTVLILKSGHYHTRVQKRVPITAKIFEKLGAEVIEYEARGASKFEEVAEVLQFGSFASYYLAMLNKVDPIDIPHVEWFKKELSK
ncbi:SIS domain-containing protein [Candidatus Uhrbacteria bacterium]|jgi:glucose/mannose-6-phosphate isomerase|nr:SIS domain-containing protein [Candidatus Uhrbacteria bacterium]MBT7717151.1 SIS domain-containing protein [Candidatus Uhrbacteria bacterium]